MSVIPRRIRRCQQHDEADVPVKHLSLYVVEASSFDLFFNKRYTRATATA